MKLHDQAQNLGIRVGTVQVIAFILLAILGVRLYYLQVVKGEYYSDKAENQRVRMIAIPAPRGCNKARGKSPRALGPPTGDF